MDKPAFFEPSETPPIPTSPVKSTKKKNIQLESETVPPTVNEYFNTGDEINEDWFGEVETATLNVSTYKHESDEEGTGNPMVLGDEDVEPIFYDKQPAKDDESTKEDTDDEDGEEENQPPVFRSELDEIWSRGLRRLSGPEVISDSEDEDNMPSFTPYETSLSPFVSPYQGYEEIGGSGDNPWSNENENENEKYEQEIKDNVIWHET